MKQKILFFLSIMSYLNYGQCSDPVITNFECGMPTQTILGNGVTLISNVVSSGINTSNNINIML